MTPGTLAALVEDNARHHENILTDYQTGLGKAYAQDLLLQQDIIADLRDVQGGPIDYPALEPQVRHALQERPRHEAKWGEQLDRAEQDIAQLLREFRDLVSQREQRMPQVWRNYVQQPVFIEMTRQTQELQQAHGRLRDAHSQLVEERDRKMPAYESNQFYVYLRSRRYGTDDYSRGKLFRQLDDWLANKVNYRENRRNELVLRSMPDDVETLLDDYITRLQAIEDQNSANWNAATSDLQGDASALRRTLLAKQIVAAKQRANAAYDELEAFTRAEDSLAQDIEQWLGAQTGDRDLPEVLEAMIEDGVGHHATLVRHWDALSTLQARIESLNESTDQAMADYNHAKELEWSLRNLRNEEIMCPAQCECRCHSDANFEGQCPCLYNDERYYTYPSSLGGQGLISSYMKRNLTLEDVMTLFRSQRQSFSEFSPTLAITESTPS